MTTRTVDIVNGKPAPDLRHLDGPAALARTRAVEARLGALRGDPSKVDEREKLKLEHLALEIRLREARDEAKRDKARRNFAGIGSPLHEAIVERLHAELVAELEASALDKLAERERRSAERKAARATGPSSK
jgi:hypothetical protein